MDKGFKDHLEKCEPSEIDQSILDDLRLAMKKAVPEIVETVRKREKAAAQYRINSLMSSYSKTGKQGRQRSQ